MKACFKGIMRQWHWIFFAAVVLLTIGMDVFIAHNILDGDTSEYMLRGWMIAQERNPFTDAMHGTTELRLLDINAVFGLFFLFSDDWSLVRVCGTLLVQALYVLSFLFLCRRARIGSLRARVFTAALMLLPFSVPYARIVVYHLHYALYMTNAFLLVGLTLWLMEAESGRKAVLPACLLGGLWVFVGLNGIRHMMILGAPMLAFAAVQALLALRHYRWENGRLLGDVPFLRTEAMRLVWILMGSCLCFLVGYALNVKVLLPAYGIMDSSSTSFYPKISPDRVTNIVNGWLMASGMRASKLPAIGVVGVSMIAALFSFGYLLYRSAASALREGPVAPRLAEGLFAASFVTTTLILLFDLKDRYYQLYYVPVVSLVFPALAAELARLKDRAVSACRKLLILLTCACFLFQGAYTVYYIAVDRWDMDEWTGLTCQDMFVVDTARAYIDFMQENGYTHAITPYWYANTMMELTDAELTVAPLWLRDWNGQTFISIDPWGTARTIFEKDTLPQKLVVFVPEANVARFEQAFPQLPKVFEYWGTRAYEITPDDID